MNLKDKLEIFIVTYNRKEFLIKTLEQLFAFDSPVRDLNITVLNNNSDDGTTEILNEYQEKFSNLIHIKHNKNIGGNANIARAYELAEKEYVWLLGDNDKYSWHVWNEIENAIENNYDVIFTRKTDETIADIYYKASLISACIYKTKNITSTILANAYDNIRFLFPHLALCAKNINDNNRFYNPSEDRYREEITLQFWGTVDQGIGLDISTKVPYAQQLREQLDHVGFAQIADREVLAIWQDTVAETVDSNLSAEAGFKLLCERMDAFYE